MHVFHIYQHFSKAAGRMRGIHSYDIELGGHRLRLYAKRGKGGGPPAVLLHGLGAYGLIYSKVFSALAKELSAVYALDLPGHGFSPLPAGGPLSLEEVVELVGRFLLEEVQEPVFLFGNSMGGALAAQVAAQMPKQVRALCLWAPAGARMSEEEAQGLSKFFDIRDGRQARAFLRRLFARAPWYAELFAAYFVPIFNLPAVHYVRESCMERCLEPETLRKLGMPTLLVWGALEKLLPYGGIEYFREHLPKAAVVLEVQGFGHMPQWESPKKCMRIWKEFAQKQGLI
ncbi:MAG: alpha/beta fold hydrolase [Proteobacteria bacterium]|nr:alpha/beta fold hydrolase [Cystobacterineae bacterium]MCL2313728.1 alpha/beta fold hydrolase [Pseudomonadota bacterium]